MSLNNVSPTWDYNNYDYLVKCILVGESGVGKSCLMKRFSENDFSESYICTIGVDFSVRSFDVNGKTAKVQIWDTAGQERFRTITMSYYRGSHVIMLVFDVTDAISFTKVKNWVNDIGKYAGSNVEIILVANKTDLESQRVVSDDEIRKVSESLGIDCIETSAKTGLNVEKCFLQAISQAINKKSLVTNVKKKKLVIKGTSIDDTTFKCCTIM